MENVSVRTFSSYARLKTIPAIISKDAIKMVFLFLAYFGAARLGAVLFAATANGSALVWPATGIAIAALFLWGYRLWPAIALAALTNSYITHTEFNYAIAGAIGYTAQAVVGAYVLKKLGFDSRISRLRDMLILFGVAFVVTMIGPTPIMIIRYLVYHLDSGFIWARWSVSWVGGILSVQVMTPLITSWMTKPKIENRKRFVEALAIFAIFITLGVLIFWGRTAEIGGVSFLYLMMLPLFFLSIRFSPKAITLAMFLTSSIFVAGLFFGRVHLPAVQLGPRLIQLEYMIMIINVIFYLLAAVSEEKRIVNESLKNHVRKLETALETIKHHALHDVLTDLPNRNAMGERFAQARSTAVRHNQKLAVMFLDLDQFKNINDTLGHNVGDEVIKETAERLKSIVREVDIVARLGGDEFIIILGEMNSEEDVRRVAQQILQGFETVPIRVGENNIQISASIGIALFPDAGDDINTLLKSADIALYRAKEKGRNCYKFYDLEMKNNFHAKLALEKDLREAIKHQQFKMLYQPIVEFKSGQIVGFESLIRWQHPQFGTLMPDEFIPLAEETGLIVPMGEWSINQVCGQINALEKQNIFLPISINLSSKQFYSNDLILTITNALAKSGVHPKSLEFEITETVAMQKNTDTNAQLKELTDMGISITMDDFGTGYSSLSYLKGLYINKLKIDKSFIKEMVTNPHDATIIRTIVSMGHTLGLRVCAEGIEHFQQKMLLNTMGCDTGQGFFFSLPLEGFDLADLIQREKNEQLVS